MAAVAAKWASKEISGMTRWPDEGLQLVGVCDKNFVREPEAADEQASRIPATL